MSQPTIFVGGDAGIWRVLRIKTIIGSSLPESKHVNICGPGAPISAQSAWMLRGTPSYERYVNRKEHDELTTKTPPLGRPNATYAALIPVLKSEAWWNLSQDERRAIFEDHSEHIKTGLRYLPAIARKLYHCRDLGEPFDFLTWFEFAPAEECAFDELVATLRRSEEWKYVEREIDIRLVRS